ncbi:MAG: methyl-accepting chemotaxis protein [Pseudomonadales bacterium]|nr:methyl-accepting chemotaxis protein [Pseudomonadales bacterium]
MFKKLSIKLRVILLSAFLGGAVILEAGVLLNNNSSILSHAVDIDSVEIPILNKAHALKLSVVQVQQWLTDISATRGLNGLDDGFDEAQKNAAIFKSLIIDLKALDKAHVRDYDNMALAFDKYYEVGKGMAHAYVDGGPAKGNLAMADFDTAAEQLSGQVDVFLEKVIARSSTALKTQKNAAQKSAMFILLGSVSIFVCGIVMVFIIVKAIVALPRIVDEMASGDLTKTYDVSGNDEVGQIMRSLQSMRDRLLNMVAKISNTTQELTLASENMLVLSNKTHTITQAQFSETEQVATAMNEMTATVQEVAINITHTSEAVTEASIETAKGHEVVKCAIEEIEGLADQIDQASNTIHQLEQDTNNITGVLDVIKGIAEQTNLLALNAAIEAARAGEQGRGFAVVADEVRTLASRTQQSTEEINSMIDKLLSGSRQAVEAMDKSREQAKMAVTKATETGDSLTVISNVVAKINDMSAQIATAAEEQSMVTEEMNRNIVHINDRSHDISANIEHTTVASKDLSGMSIGLRDIVEQFKT